MQTHSHKTSPFFLKVRSWDVVRILEIQFINI